MSRRPAIVGWAFTARQARREAAPYARRSVSLIARANVSRRLPITLLAVLLPLLPYHDTDAEEQRVVWTNIVNATVTGTVLQKTSGWDGVDDAGATSRQELSAGDGYVEFTIGETNTFWLAGLSHGNEGTSYVDIDFATPRSTPTARSMSSSSRRS